MISPKPQTLEELDALIEQGDMAVVICDVLDGKVLFLVEDRRRTYEEGELYELEFEYEPMDRPADLPSIDRG